jgi:predicted HicB family RNase H-like nuclease
MTVTIPVRVDPWINARLEEEARKAGVSKAELIRTLIAEHLARKAHPAPKQH